jgi:hypothetical protein
MAVKKTIDIQSPNARNALIGLGVILLVVAAYFLFKPGQGEIEPSPSPEEIIVQEEGTVRRVGEAVQPLSEEEIQQLRQDVDEVLNDSGEQTSLTAVEGYAGMGTAIRAFEDGKFYLKLQASGLSMLEKGYFYEGWLSKDGEVLSTGRMEVSADGSGVLYYTASQDRTAYHKVVITLEPEDGNPAPDTHILEGEF